MSVRPRSRDPRVLIPTVLVAFGAIIAAGAMVNPEPVEFGSVVGSSGPRYSSDGELVRPEGYREWIFVGTPLTPNDMNNGNAPFPEFHNVYIHPDAWVHYKSTGEFKDSTIIVKELVSVGGKQAVSGNGYFMGEFIGLEATVKDSKRFPGEPGHWAYFSFGHEYPLADKAKMFPTASCNACHSAAAKDDFVFTQYYPVLAAAKGRGTAVEASARTEQVHDGEKCESCQAGVRRFQGAMMVAEQATVAAVAPEIGGVPTERDALFAYLTAGTYQDFPGQEPEKHPSAGPHAQFGRPVRAFFNDKINASLQAGDATHPAGSAIVKEMYEKDGELDGWAVMLKSQADSDGGKGWFFYEITSTTDSTPFAIGNGVPLCFGCHSTGRDFVLSQFPGK